MGEEGDHLPGRADGPSWPGRCCLAEPGKKGTVRSREVRAGCLAGPMKVAVRLDEVLDSGV